MVDVDILKEKAETFLDLFTLLAIAFSPMIIALIIVFTLNCDGDQAKKIVGSACFISSALVLLLMPFDLEKTPYRRIKRSVMGLIGEKMNQEIPKEQCIEWFLDPIEKFKEAPITLEDRLFRDRIKQDLADVS